MTDADGVHAMLAVGVALNLAVALMAPDPGKGGQGYNPKLSAAAWPARRIHQLRDMPLVPVSSQF